MAVTCDCDCMQWMSVWCCALPLCYCAPCAARRLDFGPIRLAVPGWRHNRTLPQVLTTFLLAAWHVRTRHTCRVPAVCCHACQCQLGGRVLQRPARHASCAANTHRCRVLPLKTELDTPPKKELHQKHQPPQQQHAAANVPGTVQQRLRQAADTDSRCTATCM